MKFMPIEKYYSLKSTFGRIWGKDTYLELKHCTNLGTWKKYATRTLQASCKAILETVQIKDDYWQEYVEDLVEHGIRRIKASEELDELFQCLAATYIELSFHQIGFMPHYSASVRRTLRRQEWKLDVHRTPQYVQSNQQKRALDRHVKRTKKANRDQERD